MGNIRAYSAAKNDFLVLVLFYSKNTDVAQCPKPAIRSLIKSLTMMEAILNEYWLTSASDFRSDSSDLATSQDSDLDSSSINSNLLIDLGVIFFYLVINSVGNTFSGSNHYTSPGIVVRTTKSISNIKEAKATPFTPVSLRVPQHWPTRSGLRTLAHRWIITRRIITLDFTTTAGFEPWSIRSLASFMLEILLVVLTTIPPLV